MTLISIVVPVHNAADYLPRTLEQLQAVAAATSHDVEFVVIDDHSTDGSAEELESWGDQLEGLHLLRAESTGVALARNQAVAACGGDFVWFTDADDTWSPHIVQVMTDAAIESDADLIVSNAVKLFPDGSTTQIEDAPRNEVMSARDVLERLLDGRLQGHLWNKLFARELLGEDPFPPTRAHSDLGGILRLAPRAARAALVPEQLYTYEMRSGSILNSKAYRWQDLHDCLRVAEQAASALPGVSRSAMLTFKYRNVVIPVANELARRASSVDRLLRDESFIRNRRAIEWSDTRALLRMQHLGLVVRSSLLRLSPRVYAALYRARSKRARSVLISEHNPPKAPISTT